MSGVNSSPIRLDGRLIPDHLKKYFRPASRCGRCFVCKLVAVFREVRRVLHPSGVCFVNIGDSYARNGGDGECGPNAIVGNTVSGVQKRNCKAPDGCKQKDLLGIPWQLAFALRDDGWFLRSEITLCKTSPMPECLDPETRVFVRRADRVYWETLDDVFKGGSPYPLILTPTGWRPILHAWETVKEEAVTFEVAKVGKFTCSPEHLWPVSHDRRRSIVHELPAADLRDEGYKDYLLHYAIDKWLPESVSELIGERLDYDLGWAVGLYAAEGGFREDRGHRCKITLHAKEKELAARVGSVVAERFHVRCVEREIKNYRDVRFSSERWHRIAVAVVPGKCKTKCLNLEIVLNAPREFRQGLWDGYMEGDGSDRSNGIIATSASCGLRDTMAVLGSSLGFVTSKGDYARHDKRTGKTHDSYTLWTPWVRHRQPKLNADAKQLTIRNKTAKRGSFRMIDLEVEGGLFLVGDGVATHNSVRDRPTQATEKLFLLTKEDRYFYDQEAERVDHKASSLNRCEPHRSFAGSSDRNGLVARPNQGPNTLDLEQALSPGGRNLWNYWSWSTEPYPEAHFATFPAWLPRRCIRLGSSEKGVCPQCSAPWQRILERKQMKRVRPNDHVKRTGENGTGNSCANTVAGVTVQSKGWEPTCKCGLEPIPALIVDPFSGAGTTVMVANQLGRRAIGFELNESYVELSKRRICNASLRKDESLPGEALPLFAEM